MLEGTAFIAIVTAAITSAFVARATRESEAARTRDELGDRDLIERRFDELERKLDLLASGRTQVLDCALAASAECPRCPGRVDRWRLNAIGKEELTMCPQRE